MHKALSLQNKQISFSKLYIIGYEFLLLVKFLKTIKGFFFFASFGAILALFGVKWKLLLHTLLF